MSIRSCRPVTPSLLPHAAAGPASQAFSSAYNAADASKDLGNIVGHLPPGALTLLTLAGVWWADMLRADPARPGT
jgi:hypothetical protein